MFDDLTREASRAVFYSAWDKSKSGETLEPIEHELLTIIQAHPEYHQYLDDAEKFMHCDFDTDAVNPFLHMAMHHALMEQLKTNRPQGICGIYEKLLNKGLRPHDAEHRMLETLVDMMWQVMQENKPADDAEYLAKLQKL